MPMSPSPRSVPKTLLKGGFIDERGSHRISVESSIMERFPRLGGVCRRLKLDEARANVGLTRLRDLELNHLETKEEKQESGDLHMQESKCHVAHGGGR